MPQTPRRTPQKCSCKCDRTPPPPPCPPPVTFCDMEEIDGQCFVNWSVIADRPTRIWLVERCPDADPIELLVGSPPFSGVVGPVPCDCRYSLYARNECGYDFSTCPLDQDCPDCTPCVKLACPDPYCGLITCCNAVFIDVDLSEACGGLQRIYLPVSLCTATFEVFRDSAIYATVRYAWFCREDGTIVFQVRYEEFNVSDDSQRCLKDFETSTSTCECPRGLQGFYDLVQTNSSGACVCGPSGISAYFPEIPEGCCETYYDEETCTFCWECVGVDRVELISPRVEPLPDSGEIFIPDTQLYCIRSYYTLDSGEVCTNDYCHQNELPCCVEIGCDCQDCGQDGPSPIAFLCTCFDPDAKACKPMPQLEVTIAGITGGPNMACADPAGCNAMNGTYITPINDNERKCGGIIYSAGGDDPQECANSIEVEWPIWIDNKCFILVRMSSTNLGGGTTNERCDWFEFDYERKSFCKYTFDDCCDENDPNDFFECYDCNDISGSTPPHYSTQCFVTPPPIGEDPGTCEPDSSTGCTSQSDDVCKFDGASVSVRFL